MFGIIDKIQLQPQFIDEDSLEIETLPAPGMYSRKPASRTIKLYAMAGYIRGTAVIDIRTVVSDSLKRKAVASETIERVAKIQVILYCLSWFEVS